MSDAFDDLQQALEGRYRVDAVLGQGGMATVYLARDLKHDRSVAIKVLRPELALMLGAARFEREIDIAARLTHPHILQLIDSGTAGGFFYYVMPHVEGESLRDRLTREKQLSMDDVVEITKQMASALAYAHSRQIVHRDIKPENILLSSGGAILADFGVARALDAVGNEEALTATGLAVGTPAYMSPEQASGSGDADARSDIYSLGCVVYEMLGGEPPHSGPTPKAILARQLNGEVRPLRPIRSNVTSRLDAVIRKALDPTPADRYRTALQFADELEAAVHTHDVEPRWWTAAPVARKVGAAVAAVAAGLLVVLGGTMVWPGTEVRASEEPASLVIFPFRGTGPGSADLGTGVADLLSVAVDGTVGVRVADPTHLWRSLRSDDDDRLRTPELSEALEIARRASARSVVLGSVASTGGSLVVSARVYNPDGDLRVSLRSSVPADSLGAAINRLALDLVAEVWERDSLPNVPVIESFATTHVDALKAYLEAKRLVRQGRYPEAEQVITQALQIDSTFALAQLEHFSIRSWIQFQRAAPYTGLTEIIERAMRFRDRLTPRNRLRVEAGWALDQTDGVAAATAFERILELDSLDVEARRGLAYTYLGYGWQLDKNLDDVIGAYEHALRLDSGEINTMATLLRLRTWTHDETTLADQVDRLAARAREQIETLGVPNNYVTGAIGSVRALVSSAGARDSILDSLAGAPIPTVTTVLRDLRAARPAVAEQFLDALTENERPVFHQRVGQGARLQLWLGEGRVAAVDSVVRVGGAEAVRSVLNGAIVAADLAGVGNAAATARALEEMRRGGPEARMPNARAGELNWAEVWAVAAYQAARGDTSRAREWSAVLEAHPAGDLDWDWIGAMQHDIEARIAVRRGDLARAETEARLAFTSWRIHSYTVFENHPELGMRFHLAQILQVREKDDEAVGLYRSFGPPHSWAGFYTARASYELGTIAEAAGNPQEASFRYGQALGLWERGGADVDTWRRAALDGLRRVMAETG